MEKLLELARIIEEMKAKMAKDSAFARESADRLKALESELKAAKADVEKLAAAGRPKREAVAKGRLSPFQEGIQKLTRDAKTHAEAQGTRGAHVSTKGMFGVMKAGSFPDGIGLTSQGLGTNVIGALSTDRSLGYIGTLPRRTRLRDVLTVSPTSDSSVEYVEQTKFSNIVALVETSMSIGDTEVILDNAYGFFVGQEVTINAGKPAEEVFEVSAVDYDTGELTFTAASVKAHVAGDLVESDVFVFTPETKLKPRARVAMEVKSAKTETLAHSIIVARQTFADVPALESILETELLDGLITAEEEEILFGNGGNGRLQGIMTHPDVLSYNWANGAATDTKVDALRRAISLVEQTRNAIPDAIIVSNADWADIELTKGANGHYVFSSPTEGGEPRLWRIPVIVSAAMPAGSALVGSFRTGATLWDREQGEIRVAEQHDDLFLKNCVVVLAEERIALTVQRPTAFVAVDLSTAPVAD